MSGCVLDADFSTYLDALCDNWTAEKQVQSPDHLLLKLATTVTLQVASLDLSVVR